MPAYDYICGQCSFVTEIRHSMTDDNEYLCPDCEQPMVKQIGIGYLLSKGLKPTLSDLREKEHTSKVRDPDRAVKMRKKAFGSDAVGDPSMQTDPKHIVKRGRTLGGRQMEVDKKEFIQAAAKDPVLVNQALKVLKQQ